MRELGVPVLSPPGVMRELGEPVPPRAAPRCGSRPSIAPAAPVPSPRSGVMVLCRMKFTSRILSKEKGWLTAALGHGPVWLWETGGKGHSVDGNPGKKWGAAVDTEKPPWQVTVAFCGKGEAWHDRM